MRSSPVVSKTARPSSVTLCGDDRALQAEVESLLAADARNESVFEQSVDRRPARTCVQRGRGRPRSPDGGALTPAERLGTSTKSPDCSAPAAWAWSIGLATRRSAARSRSRSCPISGWPIPNTTRASSARRALLASLNHPNIGSIYGVHEGEPSPGSRAGSQSARPRAGRRRDARRPNRAPRPAVGSHGAGCPSDEVVSLREPGDRGARSGARARHRAPRPQARPTSRSHLRGG